MTFAVAALCLFAGWAATSANSDAANQVKDHGSVGGKSAAYVQGASRDYAASRSAYDGLERYSTWENSDGKSATYQPEGPFTADNPFFKPMGTNVSTGR